MSITLLPVASIGSRTDLAFVNPGGLREVQTAVFPLSPGGLHE